MKYHNPVLLQEVLHYLAVKPDGRYIDATLGGGGHALAIIGQGGMVLGLDQDLEAINACPDLDRLTKIHTNFTHLKEVALAQGFGESDGILFDLGVSSHQIDSADRGFSFQKEGPLDMRMNGSEPVSAANLINQLPEIQIANILAKFGEIPIAKNLAKKIVASRPLSTTHQLAAITGSWTRQVFQALRIAVNDELGSIEQVLPQALHILKPGGVLVVIAFHSLEDRLIKKRFVAWSEAGLGEILTTKPQEATAEELLANSRAKSAKLRAFKKL